MKAIVIRHWADPQPFPLEETEEPEPGPGEVRIAVHCVGVSFGETLISTGKYQVKPELPFVPGAESAGVIDTRPEPVSTHVLFLVGLVLGGLASAVLGGTFEPSLFDVGSIFARTFGDSPTATIVVMIVGGGLVGFGTRMASGCTSGHGLCGVARLQPGSLLATCAFFGTGVAFSLVLAAR